MRESFRWLPLGLSLVASCTSPAPVVAPSEGTTASTEIPRTAEPESSGPSAVETAPVAPDATALRAAAQAAAQAASLQASSVGRGPAQSSPQPGVRRVLSWEAVRRAKAVPGAAARVDWAAGYFTRLPWATLNPQGSLTLRWETRTRSPAAATFMGLRVEEDLFAAPRYRRYEFESRRRDGRTHEVEGDLSRLFATKYDVNGVRARGYGEVSWQVEQFQPETGSTVMHESRTAFRLAPVGDTVELVQLPTVVLGPFVHQLTEDRFVVSFETDVPTTAAVAVGGRVPTVSGTPGTRHELVVEGLRPGTRYAYQVAVSDGTESSLAPPREVQTRGGGTVTVAILSDSRSGVGPGREAHTGVNADVLERLMSEARGRGAQAVFFPGDLIDGYATHPDDFDQQLRTWLRAVEGIHGSIPIYTGIGNHEVLIDQWEDGVALAKSGKDSAETHFAAMMVNPGGAPPPERPGAPPYDETVYSVDLGPLHMVMLNTNYWYASHVGHPRNEGAGNREGFLMDGQLAWLEADLEAAREAGAEHIIVMGHEPAFPVGGHVKDAMWWKNEIDAVNAMRNRFWRALAKHRVLAYVSGDEHNYSRALIGPDTVPGAEGSVYSIISGGSGAPYYAAEPPPEYADRVQTFSAQQHVTLWTFAPGKRPVLEVVGLTGDVIESVTLTEAGGPG